MIIAALYWLLYGIVIAATAPLTALPDATLPAGLTAAISSAGGALAAVDTIAPVSTIVAVIVYWATLEAAILTYQLIRWVYSKIPGVS